MLKKTIRYTDFNDQEVVEDFYFFLSPTDLVEMEVSYKEGLSEHIRQILMSEDKAAIVEMLRNFLLSAYGKKSEDGRKFFKTKELREDFVSCPAYSKLFMEICTDNDAQNQFLSGIMPAELQEEIAKLTANAEENGASSLEQNAGPHPDSRVLTAQEIVEMEPDELRSGLSTGRYKLTP